MDEEIEERRGKKGPVTYIIAQRAACSLSLEDAAVNFQ